MHKKTVSCFYLIFSYYTGSGHIQSSKCDEIKLKAPEAVYLSPNLSQSAGVSTDCALYTKLISWVYNPATEESLCINILWTR